MSGLFLGRKGSNCEAGNLLCDLDFYAQVGSEKQDRDDLLFKIL